MTGHGRRPGACRPSTDVVVHTLTTTFKRRARPESSRSHDAASNGKSGSGALLAVGRHILPRRAGHENRPISSLLRLISRAIVHEGVPTGELGEAQQPKFPSVSDFGDLLPVHSFTSLLVRSMMALKYARHSPDSSEVLAWIGRY
jgi:hypothetical protein